LRSAGAACPLRLTRKTAYQRGDTLARVKTIGLPLLVTLALLLVSATAVEAHVWGKRYALRVARNVAKDEAKAHDAGSSDVKRCKRLSDHRFRCWAIWSRDEPDGSLKICNFRFSVFLSRGHGADWTKPRYTCRDVND
jgi:hypothetical protein